MGQFVVIKTKVLEDVMKCFIDEQDFTDFYTGMHAMIEDMKFTDQLFLRKQDTDPTKILLLARQIFIFGSFVKANIEQIRDIVGKIEYETMTEEEARKLDEQGDMNNLDRAD